MKVTNEMDEIALKLFIMFMTMTTAFGIIIYRGLRKDPVKLFETRLAERLSYYLQEQVCIQLNVPLSDLDKKAKIRIHGAACKAIKPLRQVKNVEIQLPNIVQTPTGLQKHFRLTLSLKDIQHLVPKD